MNNLMSSVNDFFDFLKNVSVDVKLEGWPAAVTGIGVCGAVVVICALKVTHPAQTSQVNSQSESKNSD